MALVSSFHAEVIEDIERSRFDLIYGGKFKMGEHMIWPLVECTQEDDQKTKVLKILPRYDRWNSSVPLRPARACSPDYYSPWMPYEQGLEWARAAKHVNSCLRGDDALDLLKRLCLHSNSYIASWAIHVLCDIASSQIVPFIWELPVGDNLSIGGQIAVDEALMRLDQVKWQNASQRFRLLRNASLTNTTDHVEWLMIVNRIPSSLASGHLRYSWFLEFVFTSWSIRQQIPDDWAKEWLPVLLEHPPDAFSNEQESAFLFLTNQIRESEDAKQRLFASVLLSILQPFSAEQRLMIQQLSETSSDPAVASTLTRVLASELPEKVFESLLPRNVPSSNLNSQSRYPEILIALLLFLVIAFVFFATVFRRRIQRKTE
jgi:hypothetical protein